MTSVAELLDWRPARLGTIAGDLRAKRTALVDLQDDLDSGRPPFTWLGTDANAARVHHGDLVDALVDEVAALTLVIDALEAAEGEASAAKGELEDAIADARGRGFTVDVATGTVTAPEEDDEGGFFGEMMDDLQLAAIVGRIDGALTRAAAADSDLEYALAAALEGVDTDGTLEEAEQYELRSAPEVGPPGSVKTYFLEVEGGLGVMGSTGIQVQVETLPDGTLRITRIFTDGAGYGTGAGIDFSVRGDGRDYGFTTIADVQAMLHSGEGDVYEIDPDELDDFWPALLLDAGVAKAGDLTPGPGEMLLDGARNLFGMVGPDELTLPDPVASVDQVGADGEASAAFSFVGLGGNGELGLAGDLTTVTHDDGRQTLTGTMKLDGGAQAYGGFGGDNLSLAGAEGEVSGQVSIETGPDGPEEASMTMVSGGATDAFRGGDPHADADDDPTNNYTERKVTIPLHDDDAREALNRLTREGDPSAFLDYAQDQGVVTRRTFDLSTSEHGANVEGGAIIFKGGGSVSGGTTETDPTGSQYWDGRTWRDWR